MNRSLDYPIYEILNTYEKIFIRQELAQKAGISANLYLCGGGGNSIWEECLCVGVEMWKRLGERENESVVTNPSMERGVLKTPVIHTTRECGPTVPATRCTLL